MMQRPSWGPEASAIPVKVYYRTKLPDGTMSRTNWTVMPHAAYFDWLFKEAPAKGYAVERVEQQRDDG